MTLGRRGRMTLVVLAVMAWPSTTAADDGLSEPSESDKPPELPELLDVDRRESTLRLIEVYPFVGTIVGDKFHSSVQTGGHIDFRLTPRVSIGGVFAWSPIEVDEESALGQVVEDDTLFVIQSVFSFHMPGALLMESTVFEMDVCGEIGAGIFRVGGVNRGSAFIGGAAKIYFTDWSWLGLRGDIGTHMSSIQTAKGNEFSSDFSLTVGPIFRIPPDLPKAQ